VDPDAGVEAAFRAVGGVGVAMEIVDVGCRAGMNEVIAQNVFHRAAAFGPVPGVHELTSGRRGWASIGGELREVSVPTGSVGETVLRMAQLLTALGEPLRAGEQIICGSLTHDAVHSGDHVTAGIDGLGKVSLQLI